MPERRLILIAFLIAALASTSAQLAGLSVEMGFVLGWIVLAVVVSAPRLARMARPRLAQWRTALVIALSMVVHG